MAPAMPALPEAPESEAYSTYPLRSLLLLLALPVHLALPVLEALGPPGHVRPDPVGLVPLET